MSTARCTRLRCCAGSATSNRSGNCRPPPTCAACSFIASTAWCAATPRSCCATASLKRRRSWPANASRCASIRSIWRMWKSTATVNRRARRVWLTRSLTEGRTGNVGIFLRLQEDAILRQPRRQTVVRLGGLAAGQDTARIPHPASRRGLAHWRSRRRQVHRRARVHRFAEPEPLQDSLCPLRHRLGARLTAPDCPGVGPPAGALPRRSGATDLRCYRALEPEQEAASDSHLRRSAPVAASGTRATAAAVELRHGLLALSYATAHRPAAVAAHSVAPDA